MPEPPAEEVPEAEPAATTPAPVVPEGEENEGADEGDKVEAPEKEAPEDAAALAAFTRELSSFEPLDAAHGHDSADEPLHVFPSRRMALGFLKRKMNEHLLTPHPVLFRPFRPLYVFRLMNDRHSFDFHLSQAIHVCVHRRDCYHVMRLGKIYMKMAYPTFARGIQHMSVSMSRKFYSLAPRVSAILKAVAKEVAKVGREKKCGELAEFAAKSEKLMGEQIELIEEAMRKVPSVFSELRAMGDEVAKTTNEDSERLFKEYMDAHSSEDESGVKRATSIGSVAYVLQRLPPVEVHMENINEIALEMHSVRQKVLQGFLNYLFEYKKLNVDPRNPCSTRIRTLASVVARMSAFIYKMDFKVFQMVAKTVAYRYPGAYGRPPTFMPYAMLLPQR
eukprot:GHVU01226649.1.p1 GENE.GHVU01226649.1~~GHVU01226649.1.p1  ORF type:complete len:423 (+),score=62.90 GHVU01226649.1:98-1270(+)